MRTKIFQAIDLIDNQTIIDEYEHCHQRGNVPTEVINSVLAEGFISMEIYRVENRLFMIAEIDSEKLAEKKLNEKHVVAEWDKKMAQLQCAIGSHRTWAPMKQIFSLENKV